MKILLRSLCMSLSIALAGAAWAADDEPVVTNLSSLHHSGPDVASDEGPPKGWPQAGNPLGAPLRVSGENGEFLYTLTGLGTRLVRSNIVPSQYTNVDGFQAQLLAQARDLYAADHERAPFATISIYGNMVKRTLPDGRQELVGALSVSANNKSSWSVGEPQPYPVIQSGLLFRTDFDGANPTLIATTKGSALIGPRPNGVLVAAADGTIYGLDEGGEGDGAHGRIFRLGTDDSFGVVHTFDAPPAGMTAVPNGLTLGRDGMLYGVLGYARGAPGEAGTPTAPETPIGVVYRLDPAVPGSYRALHAMTLSDGEFASVRGSTANVSSVREAPAFVVDGGDGWLYGTTSVGYCQTVSGNVPSIDTPVQYASLCGINLYLRGDPRRAGLGEPPEPRYDVDYGNTYGTVYRVRADGSGNMQVLHRFSRADGATPRGPLAVGADGAVYGTTLAGGANSSYDDQAQRDDPLVQAELRSGRQNTFLVSDGVLWRIQPARIAEDGTMQDGAFSVVHEFAKARTGKRPVGVVAGADGTLYGATTKGGGPWTSSTGVVYLDDNYGTLWSYGVAPGASVTLTISPAEIAPGGSTELTWTSDGASQCVSSSLRGDWTGPQDAAGSITLSGKSTGTYNYTLTCVDDDTGLQVASNTVQLFVGAEPSDTDGNNESFGNGGAASAALLALLALLLLPGRRANLFPMMRRSVSKP